MVLVSSLFHPEKENPRTSFENELSSNRYPHMSINVPQRPFPCHTSGDGGGGGGVSFLLPPLLGWSGFTLGFSIPLSPSSHKPALTFP